ncbi:MAG: peptidase M61 [Cyclobacteriaceae bacterium]|nr:peptidase M61 [Cyclobacteriaceae bacterium]
MTTTMTLKSIFSSIILLLLILSMPNHAWANDDPGYRYTIDLTYVKDDKVFVSLTTPGISSKEITFYMPKIIPGTYKIADYGRFITDFKATDSKGRELEYERLDDNSWKIKKAKKLAHISYWVDDTFDGEQEGAEIFQPAGTNIEDGKNFILNTSGFFGYLENMKSIPFTVQVIKPDGFYGGTGLIQGANESTLSASLPQELIEKISDYDVDTYVTTSYDHLIDSPLMYSAPDTAIIQVDNTEVLISSYSPNKLINAHEIAETLRELLMAQRDFLGGYLPVDKYAFIFYFTDQPVTSYGALEHSYSSMYFIPESPIEQLEQTIRDIAAHEFFHIITPLTIHSEEIHQFDFNEPKMSKHLWLYEGVTEYFAGIAQIRTNLIPPGQYINMLREKLISSTTQYNDSLAFTALSKYTLEQYKDQYANVYQKGALIGMCLDIKLLSLSDGKYGLKDLILDLSKKFGKNLAFQDDELFEIIAEMTYPEIRDFFSTYVEGNRPIPYEEFFEIVGIDYAQSMSTEMLTMGIDGNTIGVDPMEGHLFIRNEESLNDFGKALGLKNNDKLIAINDLEVPPLGPELQTYIMNIQNSLEEGVEYSVTVIRESEDGQEQEIRLATNNFMVEVEQLFILSPNPNATPQHQLIRNSWFGRE